MKVLGPNLVMCQLFHLTPVPHVWFQFLFTLPTFMVILFSFCLSLLSILFLFGFLFHFVLSLSLNFMACSIHVASWHIARLGRNIFIFLQSGQHMFSVLLRVYKCLFHHVVPSNVKPCNGSAQFIPASHSSISFYALLTSLSTVCQGSVFLQFCNKIQQSNLTCIKYSPTCIQQLAISNFCNTNGLYYINVRANCLYKDGLHLTDKGKTVLANNFIINLNQNFLTTHIHHLPDVF